MCIPISLMIYSLIHWLLESVHLPCAFCEFSSFLYVTGFSFHSIAVIEDTLYDF